MPRPMLRTPQNQTQSQTVNNNILSATRNQEHEQQQQQMDYQEVLIYLFQQQTMIFHLVTGNNMVVNGRSVRILTVVQEKPVETHS